MKINIVTDSSSDITQEEAEKFGITLIPLGITFDGIMYKDGINLTTEQFYEKLTSGGKLPTTSQPSTGEFLEIFNGVKDRGEAAVVILISSKLSGSWQNAKIAKDMCGYGKIYIVDSLTTICALKMLVIEANKRKGSMGPEELVDYIDMLKTKIRILGVVDTLEYLHKGGRLNKGAAVIGSILNIKPIITVEDGLVVVIDKPRGVKSAVKNVISYIDKKPFDPDYPFYFGYSMNDERCEFLKKAVLEKFEIGKIEKSHIGAVVGTHVGPNVCAAVYVEK